MNAEQELQALLASEVPAGLGAVQRPDAAPYPRHAFTDDLPDLRRMAAQGMTLSQMAARLGHRLRTLEEAASLFPDVYDALVGGKAEGIDVATGMLYGLIKAGDMGAIKLYLGRKAGWETPKGPSAPAVQINLGTQPAAIDVGHVDAMATRHTDLLDRAMSGEIEGFALETEALDVGIEAARLAIAADAEAAERSEAELESEATPAD